MLATSFGDVKAGVTGRTRRPAGGDFSLVQAAISENNGRMSGDDAFDHRTADSAGNGGLPC